jgi:hypothetical protein
VRQLNNRYLKGSAVRRTVDCHELGHGPGLPYRRSGRICTRDGFGIL